MDDERDLESQGLDRRHQENSTAASDGRRHSHEIGKDLSDGVSAFLTWKDLTLKVGNDRIILHGLCGYAEPGRLLAIMGPSGSGKSTLIDTLAGRPSRDAIVTGKILVNGRKARLSYGSAAYLGQEVALLGTLTVYETLYYSAKLRFKDSTTESETQSIVHSAIKDVGLQDSVDTRVGTWYTRGISGGEKRRVSIAVELLASPHLLFLDEPTSGLDSASSFHVIKTLKVLAGEGRTILCSIHQPSSEVFELFDELCLLSDGRQVYTGPLPRALQFFERNGFPSPRFRSPSDHYLHCVNSDFDLVERILQKQGSRSMSGRPLQMAGDKPQSTMNAKQRVDQLEKSFKTSEEKKYVDSQIERMSQVKGKEFDDKGSHASFVKQCVYLTMRSFINMHRDIGYYWLRLLMYVVLSICLGTIFHDLDRSYTSIQARAALFTFVVSFLSFMAIGGFPSFIEDLKVYETERLNGHYKVGAFAVANSLSSLPFIFAITCVSSVIIYPLTKLNGGVEHIAYFVLNLFACLVVSEALMMAVSSVVSNFLLGIILGAGTQGIYILVSGFFVLPDEMPGPFWKYPLFYLSYCDYAFEGMMQNEFQGRSFEGYRPGEPRVSGRYVVNTLYQIPSRSKWWNIVILYCMVLGYRTIFYSLLKGKERLFPTMRAQISKKLKAIRFKPDHPSYAVGAFGTP